VLAYSVEAGIAADCPSNTIRRNVGGRVLRCDGVSYLGKVSLDWGSVAARLRDVDTSQISAPRPEISVCLGCTIRRDRNLHASALDRALQVRSVVHIRIG
jgi:hypothetical protein